MQCKRALWSDVFIVGLALEFRARAFSSAPPSPLSRSLALWSLQARPTQLRDFPLVASRALRSRTHTHTPTVLDVFLAELALCSCSRLFFSFRVSDLTRRDCARTRNDFRVVAAGIKAEKSAREIYLPAG